MEKISLNKFGGMKFFYYLCHMNQYFVRYTINGTPSNNSFSTTINVEGGATAENSFNNILFAIKEYHNFNAKSGTNVAFEPIATYDVIIQVLTRLN